MIWALLVALRAAFGLTLEPHFLAPALRQAEESLLTRIQEEYETSFLLLGNCLVISFLIVVTNLMRFGKGAPRTGIEVTVLYLLFVAVYSGGVVMSGPLFAWTVLNAMLWMAIVTAAFFQPLSKEFCSSENKRGVTSATSRGTEGI